jgi:hypothetical protein
MLIEFSPQRSNESLEVDVVSAGLLINGVVYTLPVGGAQPFGPVLSASAGVVRLLLPIGPNPRQSAAFPAPVTVEAGPVPVPGHPRATDAAGVVVAQAARLDAAGQPLVVALEPLPAAAPAPTAYESDVARFTARAAVKDRLMAEMAAENVGRLRAQVWTVADLGSLMADPDLAAARNYMGTLSFELAHAAVAACAHPLMTTEIRQGWLDKLAAHFYNTAPPAPTEPTEP